ncbi:MAG TPA: right-handed parallel beta-helix repeat-containing protein [Mycobacterium sp.]
MRRFVLFIVVVTAFVLVPWPATAEPPARLACGATVTTDTKLTSDLSNCPDNGLVIGADGITLDLNGHTVGGDSAPVVSCPADTICNSGISNIGHHDVSIKGGTVQGFGIGVLFTRASQYRIQRIRATSNADLGILVSQSTRSRVDHSSSSGGVNGLVIVESTNMRLDHNAVTGAQGFAILVAQGSSRSRVDQNVLDGNENGILLLESRDITVRGNRVSHSSGAAIDIEQANGNHVSANVLTSSGDGVILTEAHGNQISDNSVTGTGFFGFPDTGGFGVILDGAEDNLIQRNTVTGGRGPAILVSTLDSENTSKRNTVASNVVNSKLDSGIVVNNNATANGDDGIHVDAAGTTVTRNTANHNLDLGIQAVPAVIDGGGNTARGNGNPAQCVNVLCR